MVREEIHHGVFVYRNAIENCGEFLLTAKSSSEFVSNWTDWYTLGRQTMMTGYPHLNFETFPDSHEWDSRFASVNNPLVHEASKAFYEATSDYIRAMSISLPNWVHGTPTINSHKAKQKDSVLAMQYHTDFIMSESECRGFKHWITCNIYLNDDYRGGEISFKVFNNEEEFEYFKYKPNAGDALVFPSHPPYFHGVHKTLDGEKFFIRMFWGYEYEGSQAWLDNETKYGKEEWAKIEKLRIDDENKSSKWMKGHVEDN